MRNLSTLLQEEDDSKSGKFTISFSKVARYQLVLTLFALSAMLHQTLFSLSRGLNNGFSMRQLEGPIATHQQEDAIAVLITGQCQRFVYRDQEEPLFSFTGNSIRPIVDVYIALHCGAKVRAKGKLRTPPYMENPDLDDIKQWYKSKGANNTFIRIIDDEHIEQKQKVVEEFVLHLHNAGAEADESLMKIKDDVYKHRWVVELRKFYMRNMVYRMTRQQGPDHNHYDWYVLWREDNLFMSPLDIYGAVQQGMGDSGSSQKKTKVWVDKPCRFGSYSDKIYIGNEQGMDLLFGKSFAEYMIMMKEYVLSTFVRKLYQHHFMVDQPEQWVHDRLLVAAVGEIDMKRIDARYEGEQRCIPKMYYSCMPNETLSMARERGIEECV